MTDVAGNRLDGDFAGEVGGTFRLRLDVLPGDVNRSGAVTAADYLQTRLRLFTVPRYRNYTVFDDVDGSGWINGADLGVVHLALFFRPPPASRPPPRRRPRRRPPCS